ncbi:MAG: efflux RND transporter periplasmic adaptor subunit [Candidatus Pacebacteria bacterium]|nr:efflux RND transporter periplasmic adaptor subunit [Candidatus Paceibacterota bacterium]
MFMLFRKHHTYIVIAAIVILAVIIMIYRVGSRDETPQVTTVVETGPVRQLVSVSGIAEAERAAELAFPVSGIVKDVLVKTGSEVKAGDTLITLDTRSLQTDRQDALAAHSRAIADREELIKGPTLSSRDVTNETIATKEATLTTTKATEEQKVHNAYQNLLSDDLSAYSIDASEDATPPTISGTYSCDKEGTYYIDLFSSGSDFGYSFQLSGIEQGTFTASDKQPTSLGTCGLQILFDADSTYTNSKWHVDIPNTRATSYTTNRNAYTLAVSQAESAVSLAEQALTLAKAEAENQNAPARSEAITRANAAVTQAQARLERIDVAIAERTLTAPFAGVVTDVDVLPGETVSLLPVVSLLASNDFSVKARVPEIDISKLTVGQSVEMLFDARAGEIVSGEVTFISPQATIIDGVAYYEATIAFAETPTWVREGLNADIDIIVSETNDGLRVPKRFVTKTATGHAVLRRQNEVVATTTVEVIFEGNDGFVVITGLTEGDTLVAP